MGNFEVKKGDTFPYIATTLSDNAGPIDLTNATSVHFRMSEPGTGNLMVNGVCIIEDQSNPLNWGKVRYEWVDGDTDIVGNYNVEWRITWNFGSPARQTTVPRGGDDPFDHVIIQEEVV